MDLYVKQLALGPMANFVYLLGAKDAREVAVVDPAWDVPAILDVAEKDGKEVVAALITHHHHDHINGLEPLLKARPNLRTWAQGAEIAVSEVLQRLGPAITAVSPGEEIEVGPTRIRCLHTPGHTPGAQCFHVGSSLFTGDTLFVGGCGRCDLVGGDPVKMFHSLHSTIGSLPDDTVIHPGHDYGPTPTATLAEEKGSNPYFLRGDLESFVAFRMRPRT